MSLIADIHNDLEKGALRLITEYRARLFADAARLCGSTADAEDLVSRTFSKAIFSLDSYKEDNNLYGWMKTIMLNIHRNDLARPVARGTTPVDAEALERYAGADAGTDELILRNSDHDALREAIDGLDPEYRQAIGMYYFNEMSLKEIAAVLSLSTSSVSRRLQLARRVLAVKLKTQLGKKPVVAALAVLLGVGVLLGAVVSSVGDWMLKKSSTGDLLGKTDRQVRVITAVPVDDRETWPNSVLTNQQEETQVNTLTKAAAAAIMAIGAMSSDGITLSIDKVQQRYPWNGLVDIDYTVGYGDGSAVLDPANDRLVISVINNGVSPATTNTALSLSHTPLPTAAGSYRVTWNANADGVDFVSSEVVVKLAVNHYAPKYMVVDVSHLNDAGMYDVSYRTTEPASGFNQFEYKTDKIVFRLIPPGSYVAGSATTEPGRANDNSENQRKVVISRPFYMGLFEVTQKQYKNVTGQDPSDSSQKGDCRPVEKVSYRTVRGEPNTTAHLYDWPSSTSVDTNNTFIGLLCKRTGLSFDLPTEGQWEYASRAGTTTPYGDGTACANKAALETALTPLGRFALAAGGVNPGGDYSLGHTTVGSYRPNAWGLYDMHGNIWEICRDTYVTQPELLGQLVDPVGPPAGGACVARGGSFMEKAEECRSAKRYSRNNSFAHNFFGLRLVRELR